MTPIRAWHEEHAHFLKLLAQLQEHRVIAHAGDILAGHLVYYAGVALTPEDWRAVAAAA